MPLPDLRSSDPLEADALQRQRREIGRGLTRSHYAAVVASGMVGLIALGALWLGAEARHQAEEARRASAQFCEFGSRAATVWHRMAPQPGGGVYTAPLSGAHRYLRLRAL